MSETETIPSWGLESLLCRDFQSGGCIRGVDCRYHHIERGVQTKVYLLDLVGKGHGHINYCKEFISKGCTRNPCKFIHLTLDEVRFVEACIGQSAVEVLDRADRRRSAQTVCRDYISGRGCCRGIDCRYSHQVEPKPLQHLLEPPQRFIPPSASLPSYDATLASTSTPQGQLYPAPAPASASEVSSPSPPPPPLPGGVHPLVMLKKLLDSAQSSELN